ncbi:histidine kinase [Streptomyces sp. NPDC059256]|uniref:sensor histidine kinase n=1 Tax=Streptomyces sp. NPDC059256 TaxID=3346794 RepID=UPI0036997BAD
MRVKGWSGRSGLAKVDLYTRGTLYVIVWMGPIGLTLMMLTPPIRVEGPLALALIGPPLAVASGVLCGKLSCRGMDFYLQRVQAPWRLMAWAAAVTAGTVGVVLALSPPDALPDEGGMLAGMLMASLAPFLTAHCLFVPNRVTALVQLSVLTLLAGLLAVTGHTADTVLAVFISVGFTTGWAAFTARASMWILGVLWQLREARDVEARLAVAEERLRFGRDLHDVLGRNLAVIALKSELAVQLARRGRPEAVDQMSEVQQIAQESQREVRDVVRGYREADLRVELEGARGVLGAAGIHCTVVAPELDLPADVQSALAWVVREATTNVLRHGDARRCRISVGLTDGEAVLVVENDRAHNGAGRSSTAGEAAAVETTAWEATAVDGGAAAVPLTTTAADLPPNPRRDRSRRPGSGLTGLRERLLAVDGTLEAGAAPRDCFRLTARVPVEGRAGHGGVEPGAFGRTGPEGGQESADEPDDRDIDPTDIDTVGIGTADVGTADVGTADVGTAGTVSSQGGLGAGPSQDSVGANPSEVTARPRSSDQDLCASDQTTAGVSLEAAVKAGGSDPRDSG